MPVVVGVVFKRAGKVYYFDPDKLELKSADNVIVKTSRGVEFGEVVAPPEEVPEEEVTRPLKKIMRKASQDDVQKVARSREKEAAWMKEASKMVSEHKMAMKLVDSEYVFDGSRVIFYFTAEERVDFRQLVKDLARRFKTRIELRQIGVRDEAKMVGGLGTCGRGLCCSVFQGDFEPVSIRMAKEQDLPLNPAKISGACGRLMCCLKYEYEAYKDFKRRAPKRGSMVKTAHGEGKVKEFNVPREIVVVEFDGGIRHNVPLEEIEAAG